MTWYCHCCSAKNETGNKCRVCGRLDSWVEPGELIPILYHLVVVHANITGLEYSLMGDGCGIYRSSQIEALKIDIHEADENGWTPLHYAAFEGDASILRVLVNSDPIVDACTSHGQTPLHFAVMSGSLECVSLLIKHKANVNSKTTFEEMTPLHMACERGFKAVASFLLDKGANVHALNAIERTPLHSAASSGRPDIGHLLIRHGAKVEAMDIHGWTCRQVAELEKHYEFAEMIVRNNMTEKQAVLKQLPPAEYSGQLWSDLVTEHQEQKKELKNEMEQQKRVERDIARAKLRMKQQYLVDHLIHESVTQDPITNLRGVSDAFYRKHMLCDKPRDTTYDVPQITQGSVVIEEVVQSTPNSGRQSAPRRASRPRAGLL